MDATSQFVCYGRAELQTTPPLSLRATYLSDKRRGDSQRITGDSQWQRRESSRRRAKHHLRTFARVIFGIVARAFEHGLAVALALDPVGDGAPRMRADR